LDLTAIHSTMDSKIAASYMYRRNPLFWLGGIAVGILIPLALLFAGAGGIAGLLALIGLLLYERVWIKAGQVVPLS
jgi:hypothetical protein